MTKRPDLLKDYKIVEIVLDNFLIYIRIVEDGKQEYLGEKDGFPSDKIVAHFKSAKKSAEKRDKKPTRMDEAGAAARNAHVKILSILLNTTKQVAECEKKRFVQSFRELFPDRVLNSNR